MGEWTKEDLEKVFLAVKKKTMTDVDFRKLALSDAAAAVKAVAGKDLPVEMKDVGVAIGEVNTRFGIHDIVNIS